MKSLNTACSIAYELAFFLLVPVLVLAPLHAGATKHLTVVQTIDHSRAIVARDGSAPAVGTIVPLYRFNSTWKEPIGDARIVSVSEDVAHIEIVPETMVWPLGLHGRLERANDGRAYATIGSDLGIRAGDTLYLFRSRKPLSQARVVRAEPSRSLLDVGMLDDLKGVVVSEYQYATQAVVSPVGWVAYLETILVGLALIAYPLLYAAAGRSPFLAFGERLRTVRVPRRAVFWIANLLAGIPFTWFMAKMPLHLFSYLATSVPQFALPLTLDVQALVDSTLPFAYAAVALAYYGYLLVTRKSPALSFWRTISYEPHDPLAPAPAPTFRRGLVLWGQHLIIAYVFAVILIGFLQSNIQGMRDVGWPPASAGAAIELSNLTLWMLTVAGCLIGYGYSVVSVLWGRYIRNLDFTVTGWLTNGFCYYPLFGAVIVQMVPSYVGVDPVIVGGPLHVIVPALALFFNVLYTLSIFNLGTMFDLMSDKGVRSSGFYSVARHPNYTLEIGMLLLTDMVGVSGRAEVFSVAVSTVFLYWIRSEREDNFMAHSNPEYVEYQKTTRYKFIPGIY